MKQEVLKAKKVVVIGGSAGIGLAVAKDVAVIGAAVIIVSSNQTRIDAALKELPANAKGYAVDASDEQALKSLFEQVGKFDHLVFTAGENLRLGDVAGTDIADAKGYFNIRYWGAFTAVKHAIPYLNQQGSVVLTSGVAARRPGKGWALGASICAAVEGLTRALSVELAPIRVNLVSPGLVRTDLWNGMSHEDKEGLFAHYTNILPVQYVATPEDIAPTYTYLMTQQYSTGQVVIVDGGAVLV